MHVLLIVKKQKKKKLKKNEILPDWKITKLKLGIYCGHKSGRFRYGNVRRIFLENPTLILSEARFHLKS